MNWTWTCVLLLCCHFHFFSVVERSIVLSIYDILSIIRYSKWMHKINVSLLKTVNSSIVAEFWSWVIEFPVLSFAGPGEKNWRKLKSASLKRPRSCRSLFILLFPGKVFIFTLPWLIPAASNYTLISLPSWPKWGKKGHKLWLIFWWFRYNNVLKSAWKYYISFIESGCDIQSGQSAS